MISVLFFSIFSLLLITTSFGLDETPYRENVTCPKPPSVEKVGVDFNWMGSIEEMYVPLWTIMYSYRIASDLLLKDDKDITKAEMGLSSCLDFKKGHVVTGYGKEITYDIVADLKSLKFKSPWPKAMYGTFHYHLTDNKSFLLGVSCWEDGITSWSVLSPFTKIPLPQKKAIYSYLENLGYNMAFAVEEDYSTCSHIPPKLM